MDVVSTSGVSKVYSGKRAVDDLRMSVPQGAIYGFVGRNGAGKSTVMKMIAGLATLTEGDIEVFGRPVRAHAARRGAGRVRPAVQRVGVLIENPGILPNMSAMHTMMALALALGVPEPRKACTDLLGQVGLADTGRKPAKGFSLGMKQRLGLAMALLGGPDLLLLDEPLNGLDPEGARAMRNYLVQLNRTRGITIVISSHVLDQLERMCTHYGVIAEGRMVRQMTAEQVQRECGDSLRVRTADPTRTLALFEDAVLGDDVRFAAEPDGSIVVSGGFEPARVSAVLHDGGQEVLELSTQSRDMEEYFVALMEGGRR